MRAAGRIVLCTCVGRCHRLSFSDYFLDGEKTLQIAISQVSLSSSVLQQTDLADEIK